MTTAVTAVWTQDSMQTQQTRIVTTGQRKSSTELTPGHVISHLRKQRNRKKLIDHPEIKKSQQLFVEKCLEVLECENYDTVSDSGGCEVRQPVKRQRYESMMSQGSVWSAKLKQLTDYPDEKCTVIESTSLGPIKICEKDFLIAHGSSGTMVYLGYDIWNGTGVAVKCMVKSGRMVQCIQRECIVINNRDLMAENIVKCYGVVETGNYVYIIQELCEKTLGQHIEDLKRQKRVQLEAKKMITEICTGLKVLHSSNPQIVHRDLKPENVLIDHHGVAKITDFGICHPVYDSSSSFMTGAAGSLCWQAQEELPNVADDTVDDDDDDDCEDDDDGLGHDNGGDSHNKAKDTFEGNKVHCSHRSDIQVMGMLIAFILSGGKHPFGKMENPFVVMENIRKGQFKLKNINNVIAKHLVGWMLEKERQDRPSIDEVLRHPYFWEVSTCLSFLVAIATELQNSDRSLHGLSEDVNENWINRAGQGPFQRMLNHEYSGTVEEFLAFTKSCNEYQNSATAENIEADLGEYILGDFPDMFIRIYCAIHETRKFVDADNWTVKGRVKPFFLT
ncbi:serine/threonine-protein kinase/endoribonuclease IRE1-like isoform X2 [Ptychodera flava]|uniref:serine/threonine-protein kinase/endoribonuclease IRE1-like isoform X2 n=1 Tax=Ptychodera flava TaxID=63121 RepID=UPI003969CF9D